MVLPATPGGSPAAREWQVNVPLTWNNDLPYGFFGARRFCHGPAGVLRMTAIGRKIGGCGIVLAGLLDGGREPGVEACRGEHEGGMRVATIERRNGCLEHERGSVNRPARIPWLPMMGVWALVFLLVWAFVRSGPPASLSNPTAAARAVTPRGDLTSEEKATITVFREAAPSVVFVTATDLRRDVFGFNVFEVPAGTGSGFIYSSEGHIVTNFHVVREGRKWKVRLADDSEWDAHWVGAEPDKDLAVLKIEALAERLVAITMGTSKDLQVGQKVLAIGNPFGFDQTLTVGVVSALGREIEAVTGRKIRDVIQTDAAINPGNSGGPLLDSAGRLIGVNTQIASPSGASAGIGFAVPVDIVNDIVPDLIRYGFVRRPILGVDLVDERVRRREGLPGPWVLSVAENSGAARAGLRGTHLDRRGYVRQLGDIIIKINDTEVTDVNELKDALEPFKAGDEIRVTFIRDGRLTTATVELQYAQPH